MTPAVDTNAARVVLTGSLGDERLLRTTVAGRADLDLIGVGVELDDTLVAALRSSSLEAVLHAADAETPFDELVAAIAELKRHTQAPVILLTRTPDLGFATRAFAAGVEDVVVLPQMIDTLAFSVRKLAELARRADGHTSEEGHATDGTVITVFSPKGGTGKTVLSTNLAATLAAERKERVLLVDLDLQFGDAAIMLGVDPERTICDLAKDPGQLDSEKLAAFTVHHPSGLDVLPAPIRPEEAELVSDEKVVRLVEVARGAYDTVVIDTSPFFYGPLLELLQPTDHLLLLCGLDVPTLKNVRISLRTLDLLGFPRGRTRLVLNRVTPNVGLTREDVERTLELPVEFEIPNDPAVARAVNRGAAPALLDAGSPFGVAIRNVVTRLHDGQPEQIASKETVRKLRWLAPSRLLEGRI